MAIVSSDVLVSSIQSEIQRVTDDLKGVDENLKRLTGLDFGESRPRGERRPRLSSSSGGWEDEPPPKRRPPGGVFARLGEPVLPPMPPRGRRVHEVPLEDGEIPPIKPSVASSVSRPVIDSKSRSEAAAELTKDKVSRERNRRMFGALLGTLQRFRTEEAKQKGKDEKRAKIEKKLEEKGRVEKEELLREKRELISQRKERQERIRRLTIKMERVKEHEAWEEHQRKLGKFIRTKAKPRLFWVPKYLQSRTSQLVKDTKEEIEKELAEQRIRLKEELDDLLGGNLDLAPAQEDEEEEEEREMEGEANLMAYNNGSDLLDFDAEEGELEFEDDLMLSGKDQQGRVGKREVKGERVVVQFDSSVNRPPQRRVELVTVVPSKRSERTVIGVHESSESEKENVLKGRVVIKGDVNLPMDAGRGRVREKEEKKKHKEREKDKEKKDREKRKGKEKEKERRVIETTIVINDKSFVEKSSDKKLADIVPAPTAKASPTKKELKKAQRKAESERKKKEAELEEIRNKEKEIAQPVIAQEEEKEEEEDDDEAATEERLWNDDLSRISLPLEPEPLPEEQPDSDAAKVPAPTQAPIPAPAPVSAPNVTEVVVQHVPMEGLGGEGAEEDGEGEETLPMETMLIDTSAIKTDKTEWGEAGHVPIVIIKKEKNPSPPRMGLEEKDKREAEKNNEKESNEEEGKESDDEEEKESDGEAEKEESESSDESDSSSDSEDSSDDDSSASSSSEEESSSSSSSDDSDKEEKRKKRDREKRKQVEKRKEKEKSESSSDSDSSSSSEDDRKKKRKSPPRKRPSGGRKSPPKHSSSRRGEEKKRGGRRSRSRSRSRNRKSRDTSRRSRSRDRVKKRERSRSKDRRRDRR